MSSSLSEPSSTPDGGGGAASVTDVTTTAPAQPAHRVWLVAAVVPFIVALAIAGRARLNGDVTYAFGGMRAAAKGGVGIGDLFIARPYAYRVLISLLDDVRAAVTSEATSATAEWAIRLGMCVIVVLVGALLYAGLRRYMSGNASGIVAVIVTGSMLVAPPWHFLEPDWVGAVVGVAVVGLTLWPRAAWLGVVLGSVAVWLTIAMKTATFTWGLIGLVAVALLAWRRALGALIGGLLLTAGWVGWMKLTGSWEWIWLRDQAKLVDDSPLNHGLQVADLAHLGKALVNVAVVSPIMVGAAPAAALLIVRQDGARRRWRAAAILALVAVLSVGSAYGQGEWFMYHFAGTPIVAAALWALALVRPSRARWALIGTVVAASGFSIWAMAQPLAWRLHHLSVAAAVIAAIAVVGLVATLLLERARPESGSGRGWPILVAAVAAALAVVTPGTPRATYAFDAYDANIGVSYIRGAADPLASLRQRMGPDTRVTYFAFGSQIYGLGNPTTCRYPSPQWLQRAAAWPRVRAFKSYTDNLKCLENDGGAQYLVWQPGWFSLKNSAPAVRAYADRFDCSRSGRMVGAPVGLVICPLKK